MNYVSWYDAIRFANWLNNGQVPGSTETGAYTLGPLGAGGIPINGNSITRNAGATVFLPSENEWYKAAYYNPATSSYYQYPTSSNTPPRQGNPAIALPNSANWGNDVGNLTNVGAYNATTSPYGAYDMGGNVWQWNEAFISFNGFPDRGLRGGSFDIDADFMLSSFRSSGGPAGNTTIDVGFRVASIPEPSAFILAALGGLALLACRGPSHLRMVEQ